MSFFPQSPTGGVATATATATATKAPSTSSTLPTFPGGLALGNFQNLQLPQLSPEALKSVTKFLNSTAQSVLLTRAIGGMMDNAISDVSTSFSKYRIKPPATGPVVANTRRLQQASTEKGTTTGTTHASSVEVTAEDVIKALQQLQEAAAAGEFGSGPAGSVDLQFSDGTKPTAASMKRKLLASSVNDDINAYATQLQQQVKDAVATWQRLENGAVISGDEFQAWLASRAAGLKQRFETLKTRFEAAANSATVKGSGSIQRRLLQENNKKSPTGAAAAPAPETEENFFFGGDDSALPGTYTTSTMVVLMTPADTEASAAFIDDVLNFLMDTITASSFQDMTAFTPQAFGVGIPMFRSDEAVDYYASMYESPAAEYGDGDESDQLLQMLTEGVTAAAARWPEQYGTAMAMEFPSGPAPEPSLEKETQGVSKDEGKGGLLERRRRQLLGVGSPSSASYNASPYDDFNDLDSEYEQEEAWLWVSGDDDWMSTEASKEEAILQYAEEADESELLDLVVKLVAPVNENGDGISPALMEILLDPANASVAQLLKELAAGPAGGELSVAKQSGTEVVPPRFAVFGPSVVAGFGQAAAVGAHLPRHIPENQREGYYNNNNGKMIDMVAPLRGPKPHTERDMPSGMDARWWGVVLGLGGLGLLLVGAAAIAAMKPQAPEIAHGEDSVHGVGRGAGGFMTGKRGYESVPAQPASPISASPWEKKGQAAKIQAQSSGTPRKTSNLPA